MDIKVRYLPPLSTIINKKVETIDIPKNFTIQQFIELLVDRYGETFKKNIYPNGDPSSERYLVNFTCNDEIVKKEHTLLEKDTVTIFMALSGG